MRYDEETGILIDDGEDPAPMPCQRGDQGGQKPEPLGANHVLSWGLLALAFVLGMICENAGLSDKLHNFLRLSDHSQESSIEDEMVVQDWRSYGECNRLIIACSRCNAQLDASELQHLQTFDCVCPDCGAHLHVEQSF